MTREKLILTYLQVPYLSCLFKQTFTLLFILYDLFPVSSFRIFRTSHRSLSPSIKSTNRQASVISSTQDSPSNCKSSDVKYTGPQQLGVMGKLCFKILLGHVQLTTNLTIYLQML